MMIRPSAPASIDNYHLDHRDTMLFGTLIARHAKVDVPALAPYIN
jgi:hypothetical protein